MSKATPQDLLDLQFTTEQFNAVANFSTFLQGVIDGQESLLIGRIGQNNYNSSDTVIAAMVKQAAISLSAAELIQRRIVRLSGNVNSDTVAIIKALQATQQDHAADAERNITRMLTARNLSDSSSDFASGCSTSSHFDSAEVI